MAVEIGTASGHVDLAEKLEVFLTTNADLVAAGQNWTLLEKFPANQKGEWIYKAPGLTTQEEIILELQVRESTSLNYYNWAMRGATGYNPGNGFDGHPNDIDDSGHDYIPFTPFWQNDIPYWFVANGQRVIVVGKVNNTYQSVYMGKFTPYATPSQYALPLFIGGMSDDGDVGYSHESHRFFVRPYNGDDGYNCRILTPWGVWAQPEESSSSYFGFYSYPYNPYAEGNSHILKMVPFDSGDAVVIPVYFYSYSSDGQKQIIFGELDGAFWVHGRNQTSESTLTINGDTYMVFGDGGGTGDLSYMAIRMV